MAITADVLGKIDEIGPCTLHGETQSYAGIKLKLKWTDERQEDLVINIENAQQLADALPGLIMEAVAQTQRSKERN